MAQIETKEIVNTTGFFEKTVIKQWHKSNRFTFLFFSDWHKSKRKFWHCLTENGGTNQSEISRISLAKGIELSEMRFSHPNGKPRRYIIVKKRMEERPNSGGKLFEDLPGYRFSCYVTNLDLPLDQIWNLYNSRADCENRIKELKQDFGLENFCLKDFWATEASFRMIIVAYNLISLFRHFALNERNTATHRTLKSYCFALGAWTANHAGKKVLKIALPVKRKQWMDSIFTKIENLPLKLNYS